MAKKEHIIPTQVISVAGYSLSLMLVVFAAALYMGWLPVKSDKGGLASQKPDVPVVRSPDAPAKTKVAEPSEPIQEQEVASETPQSKETQETIASEQPSPPTEEPIADTEPEKAQPGEPKPLESAQNERGEDQTSQSVPPEEETAQLESQPEEKLPEDQATPTPPEADVAQETDVDVPGRGEDTLTAQDLKPEAGPEAEDQQPAESNTAKTVEPDPETKDTVEAPLPAAPEPGKQAKVETQEPEVRIIVPPKETKTPEQSPSVVIRIPQDPTEELKVLPRPKVVQSPKPELVQQAPKVVVQIPQTQEQIGDQSQRPAVPRAKPVKKSSSERKTVELPRIDPPQPSAQAKTKPPADTAKTDSIAIEVTVDERAPQPLAKPEKVAQAPDYTATITPQSTPQVRIRKKARRKPKATGRRTQRSSKASKPETKLRRTRLARTRIHRPPVGNHLPRQTVSFDQDTYCLAIAIYYEAGRKNLRDQVAVSREILHRVESFNFPNSVCEVVYQYAHRRGRCRYAFACDGLPDRPKNRSVWHRAKMLAKAQINCGPRCGCYLQKPTLVSSTKGRSRRVIRCRAGIETPGPRKLANSRDRLSLQIRPVASRQSQGAISSLGRVDR
ncbi:MAG: hypothetical protein HKN05_03715 [Rhizobiales bacterium]|nr:hypothetical protein [Hyphomicrobiales bacterium]